jgi:hypothetical protein
MLLVLIFALGNARRVAGKRNQRIWRPESVICYGRMRLSDYALEHDGQAQNSNPLVLARFSTSFKTLRQSRRLDSIVSRFLLKEGKSGALGFDAGESVQAKDRSLL